MADAAFAVADDPDAARRDALAATRSGGLANLPILLPRLCGSHQTTPPL